VEFHFRYDLDGSGFATAILGDGERSFELTATFHRDTLGELANAVLRLANGAVAARAIFVDEFGEHHLALRCAGDGVALAVTRHPDAANLELCPLGECAPLIEVATTVAELRAVVAAELARLLAEHGPDGYRAKWIAHDFPMKAFRQLTGECA
jgi:hypothetical protein